MLCVGQYIAPKGSDKICTIMARPACIELLRARIGEWNNNLCDGFQLGYVRYRLPLQLEFMDLDTFSSVDRIVLLLFSQVTDKIQQLTYVAFDLKAI